MGGVVVASVGDAAAGRVSVRFDAMLELHRQPHSPDERLRWVEPGVAVLLRVELATIGEGALVLYTGGFGGVRLLGASSPREEVRPQDGSGGLVTAIELTRSARRGGLAGEARLTMPFTELSEAIPSEPTLAVLVAPRDAWRGS